MSINHRKSEHLKVCLEKSVEYGNAGFDEIHLIHRALPELDFDEISTDVRFLGKKLRLPLMIEGMTGGTRSSEKINKDLAQAASKFGVAFQVGSQRAAIEDKNMEATYCVRDVAPKILLIANLGAVQLNCGYGLAECKRAVKMIKADALALHINPLQEVIQPEGDKNFSGLINKINKIARGIDVPVIAKEVGSGITARTAKQLKVSAIDVGGLGGTSWSLVEGYRNKSVTDLGKTFANWGTPTAECVGSVSKLKVPVIASGGVRSGLDMAKAIALGASCCGIALPVLRAWKAGKKKGVEKYLEKLSMEMRVAMFLTGSKNIRELRGKINKNLR